MFSRAESISHEWAKRTSERYFQHSNIIFVSPRGHVISSIHTKYWMDYLIQFQENWFCINFVPLPSTLFQFPTSKKRRRLHFKLAGNTQKQLTSPSWLGKLQNKNSSFRFLVFPFLLFCESPSWPVTSAKWWWCTEEIGAVTVEAVKTPGERGEEVVTTGDLDFLCPAR